MSAETIMATECPRPDKRKLTREQAESHVKTARKNLNPDIRAYQCICGDWHVGKNKAAFDKRLKQIIKSSNYKQQKDRARNDKRGRR